VAHLRARTGIEVVKQYQATRPAGINRQELQQVLVNLLINAIQVMPDGGTLVLRTRDWQEDAREDSPSGVVLEVQDSGPGLPAQGRESVFRPFFTTRSDGNGLGLWISLGLVERYGGSMEAHDAPGAGALFRVRLLTEPQAPPGGAAAPA
jgi:two-component system, NtrC family, sensor kinase